MLFLTLKKGLGKFTCISLAYVVTVQGLAKNTKSSIFKY